jgi:hypothetical protein
MNKLLKIKHIHHLLELVLYKADSIENLSDLKGFVKFYCNPKDENETIEISLSIIEYTMKIGAKKVYFLEGKGEYSLSNNNINEAIQVLRKDWLNLQTTRKINNQEWLVEYWLEWTDSWRNELQKIEILKYKPQPRI